MQPTTTQSQQQLITDVDQDIFARLVKAGVLKQIAKPKITQPQGGVRRVQIDTDASQIFESGIALSKYLMAAQDMLQKRGITDFNVDTARLSTLKQLVGPQTKLYNWNIITHELDKVGVKIEGNAKIVAGDQESILALFRSLDKQIMKLTGLPVIEFEELKQQDSTVADSTIRRSSIGKPKKRTAREGVDILTMKVDRDPDDTESSLELILNTLCRAFSMKPKQAAALLTNNNQFLIHSIVKGVKGNYDPLVAWYAELKRVMKTLISLLEIETDQLPKLLNIPKVLGTLSSGLFSQNIEICRNSFDLLNTMNQEFSKNQAMFKQAQGWVVEKEGGLECTLQALKRHPDLAGEFINFVAKFTSIMNQSIDKIYKDEFRKLYTEPSEYVNVINDIFPYLVKHSSKEVKESGILDFWIDLCLEQAGIDGQHTVEEKIPALTLLSEIWLAYTEFADSKADRLGLFQQVLKKACRDRQRNLRIVAVSLSFRLLDKFAEEKNPSAPAIYKSLIFSLIENPADILMREHYFQNFIALFDNQQGIPLNLLLDPLVKQILISENVTYLYKVFDFDFFTSIASHPKLTPASAVNLADMLAKIYLKDLVHSTAASVPLMMLCSRYNLDEAMWDFIIKFETVCLSSLMSLEKDGDELQKRYQQILQEREQAKQAATTKKPLALPAPPEFEHKHGKPTKRMTKEEMAKQLKEQEQEASRRLKKSLIIQVLLKLQNLKHEELNEQLRQLLLSSNRRFYNNLYGYYNKGIMTLLRYWGDAETLMADFMKEMDEKEENERREQQERDLQEKQYKEKRDKEEKYQAALNKYEDEMSRLRQSLDNGAAISEDDQRRLQLWEEEGQPDFTESEICVRDSQALMLYQGGTSKMQAATLRNAKALQQIEKIQRSKVEQEEQKKLEEERKQLASQRKKQKLKEILDKRKMEHGVGPKTDEGPRKDQLVFDDGVVEQEKEAHKKAMGKMMLPEIKLLNLDEEEDRDKEAMNIIMKKYAKLWKNLYYKYSNSGFNPKNVSNFDQYNERSQTISIAEMTKLLRDHNTFPTLISKEELQTLFRMVNTKLFKRLDLQALDYPAYQQLILQLAYFCFTRPPTNLSHFPPVETVRALIKQFEDATRARGNSTVLYEDPDATNAADSKLIKALNDKLKQDPQYPIPEGYIKQMEKTPIYDYHVPHQLNLKPSQVVSLEVLDSILNDAFGFHFLEPTVKFEEKLKVKLAIKSAAGNQDSQSNQAEALSYMKRVEKKVKPIEQSLNPYASLSALDKLKLQQEVKPELTVALKLAVAQYPIKERALAQDVAEVLEEILQASEKGLTKLPPRANRAPGQVWNEAKQKKKDDIRQEKDIKFNKEDKRKKRDEQVKNELQKLKEQKEKEEQENKKKAEEEAKLKAAKAKALEEKQSKRLEKQKQDALIADSERKKKEEEKKKTEVGTSKKKEEAPVDPVKAKTERKDFMKQQKNKIRESFQQMVKQREDLAQKQEKVSAKEIELKSKIRQSMESYVKETAPDRGKEQRERKQINEFLQQEDVQQVFARYDQALRQMFKFYASQEKKDVGFNLERAMNTMSMRELVKFSYQELIIPTLLQPEDIVQIFRQLMREKQDDMTQMIKGGDGENNYLVDKNFAQIIDFDQFKKVLVRVATLAATEQQAGAIDDHIEKEIAIKKKNKPKPAEIHMIASQRSRSTARPGPPKSQTVDPTSTTTPETKQ